MLIAFQTAAALDLRRRWLVTAPLGCALPANAAEQMMRTSSDIGSYADATGSQRAANLGAGSISGKSRPYTGVVLAAGPNSAAGVVAADVILTNGVLAKVAFAAPELKLAKGFYYDVEARAKTGDSAYLHVIAAPQGGLDGKALASKIPATDGRYGAFGPPTDVIVSNDVTKGDVRTVDLAFSAITPGGATTPRRAVLAATQAEGSPDVLVLVASASEARWNQGGADAARRVASTFRVDGTRPTKLRAEPASGLQNGGAGRRAAAQDREPPRRLLDGARVRDAVGSGRPGGCEWGRVRNMRLAPTRVPLSRSWDGRRPRSPRHRAP